MKGKAMTTTKPEKTQAPTSLVLELENAVLALEAAGTSADEIFSFVNMILKGFITNGMFTPEYIDYCRRILAQKTSGVQSRTIIKPGEF